MCREEFIVFTVIALRVVQSAANNTLKFAVHKIK